jgi:hypothetical protein
MHGRVSLVFALALVSCGGPRRSAESDLAAAERAVTALPADASRVVPDEATALSDAVNRGKDEIARGEFAAASTTLREVPERARLLADSLPSRRQALSAMLDTLAVAMPRNLAAMGARLDSIGRSRRLPAGVDEQELAEARETHAAAQAEWPQVMSMAGSGELAQAATRALQLKDRVSRSLLALGLVSDERAWSNVTLPPR